MAIERKCILCQIIYNSKQEMDEHMRSMLHHRELENLKGRDSGHECKVCRVMVVGLTDYASHISSPVHKQRVEDSDRQNAADDHEEEYFDKELVELINKRRESIRKEEEAAAAKLARENEERKKKEDFQRRLMIAKQAYQQDRTSRDWQRRAPPTKGFKGPIGPDGWNGNNVPRGQSWDIQADPRNWHHGRQGKSATWHAQEPPNLQNWGAGEWAGGGRHSRGGWGNKRWSRDSYPGDDRGGRLPWFDHGPNDNGVPLSSSFYYSDVPLPQASNSLDCWNGGSQNGEGAYLDNNAISPKGFGSNPKIDKACRWAPYPPTKIFSPPPQEGAQPSHLERPPNNSDQRPKQDSNPPPKPSKWDQKEKVARPSADDKVPKKNKADGDEGERRGSANGVKSRSSSGQRDTPNTASSASANGVKSRSSSGQRDTPNTAYSASANGVKSRSSSGQRDTPNTASSASAKQKAEKPSKPPGRQLPSTPSPKAPLSRSSSQDSVEQQKPSKSCPKVHQPSKSTSQSPQFSKPSPPVPQPFRSTSQTTKFSKPSPKPPQPSFHLSKSTSQIPQSCALPSKSSSKIPQFSKFTSQSPQLSKTCPQVSQPSTNGSQTLRTSSYSLVGPSLMSSLQGDSQPQSLKEQQLSEMLRRAKETLLVKKSSIDLSPARRAETVLHIKEQGEQSEHPQVSTVPEANKDSNPVQNPTAPAPVRHRAGGEERTESGMTSSRRGSGLWLQSVQVSTSTKESTPSSAREGEGKRKEEEKQRGGSEKAAEPVMHGVEAGQGSERETLTSSSSSSSSSSTGLAALPALSSKLGLLPPLKRDLSKHSSVSKAKAGGHEPNLNIARRIRNVSGTWRPEAEKESGLKPTVRQLISSSGSRRNVNWDQVYQEVCRKRQGQGKGMPRFGIEMVSYEQEDKEEEEEEEEDGGDLALLEGIEWEGLFNSAATVTSPITPRKRCLSESSIAPSGASSSSSLLTAQAPVKTAHGEDVPSVTARRGSEQKSTASAEPAPLNGKAVKQQEKEEEEEEEEEEGALQRRCQVKLWRKPKGNSKNSQNVDSAVGDSSSEMDLTDTQGTGKKRRAAGDIPTPELPSLESKTKRRKLKSKKERLQVDQLLTVSLKEEELSHSLQAVDHSLIQARAALQAAYMEVQRLLVVKQQVSTEMSMLRTKRIELLQGIQGELDGTVEPRVKELDVETLATVPCGLSPPTPSLLSPTTDAAIPSPCHSAWEPPRRWADPSLLASVSIKTEPLSPDRTEAVAPAPSTVHRPHHGSPERPVVTVTDARSDLVQNLSGVTVTTERPALAPRKDSLLGSDTKKSPGTLSHSSSRRASETGCLDPSASLSSEPAFVFPMPAPPPPCPPEPTSGKRVRKLKKKRVLRKAQGSSTEKVDTSDTELEGEEEAAARPPRKLRARRRRSGGSWISTSSSSLSTPLATADQNQGSRGAPEGGEGAGLGLCLPPGTKAEHREESSDSSLEMVELPQPAPSEVVTIDTSGPEAEEEEEEEEEGLMEVCLYNQGSQTEGRLSLKAEPENLACNEVSSTSEMEGMADIKSCKSDTQMALPASIRLRTSSDVSSDVGEEDIPAEGSFEGHQEAVNGMQIHGGLLYTCSGDRTVRAFHLVSRKCVAVFEGHSSKVNCLLVSSGPCLQHRLYSGSSDQTLRCYSLKTQQCLEQFSLPDRVLCLHSRWKVLYAGLANGSVITFNVKTNKQLDVFECHGPRAVSCLATAQEGARRILLVGSYDSTISVRDAKSGLLLRTLEGHTKTILCMKVVNDLVFSGSSDQSVHAHNIHTGELVRIYKNHSHAVTVVAILGKVMVTACLDKLVRVYELQSHERLQVYGGHSDMVMCMTIHNSMIYTGCYDGSVQAVKLNLMQNHRCMWQGCSLIFGVVEHLQHHLLNDHGSFNFQTLKCRWKNCDEFFSARNGTKQGLGKHLQRHVEEEMKLES